MPGILKSNVLTYEFSPQSVKELIAADLDKKVEEIEVTFNVADTSDDRFGGSPRYEMTRVTVNVKQKVK